MPITIKLLDNALGVLFTGEGTVSGKEIIDSNGQVFSSEERMKEYKYGLVDYSKITQFNVSTPEVETIVSQEKRASESVREGFLAIVAENDFEYGTSRMWESIAEIRGLMWETMVFRYREEAEAWIRKKVDEKFGISDLTFG